MHRLELNSVLRNSFKIHLRDTGTAQSNGSLGEGSVVSFSRMDVSLYMQILCLLNYYYYYYGYMSYVGIYSICVCLLCLCFMLPLISLRACCWCCVLYNFFSDFFTWRIICCCCRAFKFVHANAIFQCPLTWVAVACAYTALNLWLAVIPVQNKGVYCFFFFLLSIGMHKHIVSHANVDRSNRLQQTQRAYRARFE